MKQPSLKNAPIICPTLLPSHRINRVHWSDSPTVEALDYPNLLRFSCFFVALVQLVAAVIWLDISMVGWTPRLDGVLDILSRRCIGHLVSTVYWTPRLNGALDVSDMTWTSSKGPKKSYKYNLANSLVSLIALSHDHQNHSK